MGFRDLGFGVATGVLLGFKGVLTGVYGLSKGFYRLGSQTYKVFVLRVWKLIEKPGKGSLHGKSLALHLRSKAL